MAGMHGMLPNLVRFRIVVRFENDEIFFKQFTKKPSTLLSYVDRSQYSIRFVILFVRPGSNIMGEK